MVAEGVIYRQFAEHRTEYTKPLNNDALRDMQFVSIGIDFGGSKSLTAFVATALHMAFHKVTVVVDHHIKAPKGEIDADRLCREFVGFVHRLRTQYPWLYIKYVWADNEAQYLINSLRKAAREAVGAERDYIMHNLNRALDMSEQELIRLFDEAATRSLAVDDAIYHAAGYNPQPLADNTYMQQLIRAGLVKALEEYRNLTLTTAATATGQFENALDLAYHKVASGGFSYQQAVRDGIRSLTRKGLATIQYPTGWVDYLDVAFRRATLTGVNQTATELQIQRAAELETDIMELTAHHGARPEHAAWQGRLVSLSGKRVTYLLMISTMAR